MELGRMEARGEQADQILAKIEKIKPELIRNFQLESRTRNLPATDLKLH